MLSKAAIQGWQSKMSVSDAAAATPDTEDRLPLNVSLLVITGLSVMSWGFVAAIAMAVHAVL